MGNTIYRPTPRRTHSTEEGKYTFYSYGASQITGWRNKQEDRYICLPKFHEDFSLFAVYDGHGGEEVVQYLHRFLHQHVYNELILHNDPQLALYLGFLTCDNSLRNITKEELTVVEDDLDMEFEVPDREERREVIFGLKGLISNDSAGASKNDCAVTSISKDSAESATANKGGTLAPGTSRGTSNPDISDDLKAEIVSSCLNQLPSLLFLTQAPMEDDDESDEEYEPQKDNIKHDFFETAAENEEEELVECDDSSEDEDENESAENEGEENGKTARMEVDESSEKEIAEEPKDCEEGNYMGIDAIQKNAEAANSPGCSTDMGISSESQKNEETKIAQKSNIFAALNQPVEDQFSLTCGSTATVLLLNEKKIYLANVGDSRCVACINGQAFDLSFDHKPTIRDEQDRIIDAGGTISEDFRVNGCLDVSRAFGDFVLKQKNVAEPFQVLSCEPYVATIDVTPNLEFIIIASDGIWNTMDSSEVVDYLKNRMQDTGMALTDICGELFEEMLPSRVTADGSGCDNMSAILIKFQDFSSSTITGFQECFKYYYPPQHRKKYFPSETDNSARQEDMLPDQGNEKGKPESEEVVSSLSTSESHCEKLDSKDELMEPIQIKSPLSSSCINDNESVPQQNEAAVIPESKEVVSSLPISESQCEKLDPSEPIQIRSPSSSSCLSDNESIPQQNEAAVNLEAVQYSDSDEEIQVIDLTSDDDCEILNDNFKDSNESV